MADAPNADKFLCNGIDYLEVDESNQSILELHLIHKISEVLSGKSLSKENIVIEGGIRVRGIKVEDVQPESDQEDTINITVNTPGDFSTYTLKIISSQTDSTPPKDFDSQFSEIEFSFKVNCPSDFDCKQDQVCLPEFKKQPDINYLAKDYASFRQLMLDRMSLLIPDWRERNPADLGIALVELLAYVGDHLSYQQDAIATEAYIGTARRRISIRRHARLVDYFMHDGCNARVLVQITANADGVKVSKGSQLLTQTSINSSCIPPNSPKYAEAMNKQPEVFETMHDITLFQAHNEIHFYTWGDEECCLPKGATHAFFKDNENKRIMLRHGDVLIFEELRGPETGRMSDADPAHRHAVRLTEVHPEALLSENDNGKRSPGGTLKDPLTSQAYVEIKWSKEDALPFPLCLHNVKDPDKEDDNKYPVSVASANIVLADHGMAIPEPEMLIPKEISENGRYRPHIAQKALTFTGPFDPTKSATSAMRSDAYKALPAIKLKNKGETWNPQYDLLASNKFAKEFVVEMESDGIAHIRFGDGNFGKKPDRNDEFRSTYRVGNGASGNVGADSIAHIVTDVKGIEEVRNPLPAKGGIDQESIEHVRQSAPWAFRTQERAVTPEDYAEVAQRHNEVQRAVATFRWTGSWHTVFLTIDRRGGLRVDEAFEKKIRNHMEKYRMSGYDLEVDGPLFVSLEIDMNICVKPDHFRSDVKEALFQVLSNSTLPDGRRGIFHPDNFTFGQTVYVSPIIAAAQAVDGVDSVKIIKFQKQGIESNEALDAGKLILGRLEIARLDNDPNYPEHGVLNINVEGGK